MEGEEEEGGRSSGRRGRLRRAEEGIGAGMIGTGTITMEEEEEEEEEDGKEARNKPPPQRATPTTVVVVVVVGATTETMTTTPRTASRSCR